MGCAKSKEAPCDERCQKPRSFNFRSQSSPFRRRSRRKLNNKSDTKNDHTNSLRSSNVNNGGSSPISSSKKTNNDRNIRGNESAVVVDKASSNTMQEKVPTQCKPPSSNQGETINAWELMDGLEGNTPPRPIVTKPSEEFSFQVITDHIAPIHKYSPSLEDQEDTESKPVWLQTSSPKEDSVSKAGSIVSDFDPEIISTFRKALDELSPKNALLLRSPGSGRVASPGEHRRLFSNNSTDFPSPGNRSRLFSKDSIDLDSNDLEKAITTKSSPFKENVVVLYFTSLRGVRKTYEDCCNVKVILKGLGVKVDERDVSMHYGFREELRQLLGTEGLLGRLPKVFVKGKYIGTAEDVRRMHENGELEVAMQGCEMVDESVNALCEVCGNIRFVPCEMCSGSCKIYIEENEHGVDEEGNEESIGGFQRCPYCNENGIVRCPICCS